MAKRIKQTDVPSIQKLSIADGGKAYGELREQVMKDRILDRDYWYYARIGLFAFGGFFCKYLFYLCHILTSLYCIMVCSICILCSAAGRVYA